MMYPMAPSPSSSGISRSIVTMSGTYLWSFRSASCPSRAVATTRNSPEASMISVSTRRKRALSSTTRTDGSSERSVTIDQRPDRDRPVGHPEAHRAAGGAAGGLGHDRDAEGRQRLPAGDDVALAHLHGAHRRQVGEHAGAADQPGR